MQMNKAKYELLNELENEHNELMDAIRKVEWRYAKVSGPEGKAIATLYEIALHTINSIRYSDMVRFADKVMPNAELPE